MTGLWGVYYDNAGGSPYATYLMARPADSTSMGLWVNSGGAWQSVSVANGILNDGAYHSYVAVFHPAQSYGRLWRDGRYIGQVSYTQGSIQYGATATITLMGHSGATDRYPNAQTLLAGAIMRPLRDTEALHLARMIHRDWFGPITPVSPVSVQVSLDLAFPVCAETDAGAGDGTADIVVTMPSTKEGKLIVGVAHGTTGTTFSWPGGWTEMDDRDTGSSGASWAYRDLNGTEGSSITVTASASGVTAWIWARVTGGASGDPDWNYTVIAGTGPPDSPSLTPAGGSDDYLWLSLICGDSSATRSFTGAPDYYTNYEKWDYIEAGGATCIMAVSSRPLTASVENPGAYSVSEYEDVLCYTIAVAPGGLDFQMESFRFYEDDGYETGTPYPTALANEDTNASEAANTGVRIRTQIQAPEAGQYQLEVDYVGGSNWMKVI